MISNNGKIWNNPNESSAGIEYVYTFTATKETNEKINTVKVYIYLQTEAAI